MGTGGQISALSSQTLSPNIWTGPFINSMWLQVKKGLLLEGTTSVKAEGPWNGGCWRKVSECIRGFSVAVWINIENRPFKGQHIISAMPFTNSEGWKLTFPSDGSYEIRMEVNDARGSGIQRTHTVNVPGVGHNVWHHYIFTYRAEDNHDAELIGYVNGNPDGTGANGIPSGLPTHTEELVFGGNYYMNIRLDELLIFDGVLDQDRVKLLYEHYHIYDI